MRTTRKPRWLTVSIVCLIVFLVTTFALTVSADGEPATDVAPSTELVFTLDDVEYDLSDGESAQAYVDGYADNLNADPQFKTHLDAALATVRESIGQYATVWALLPPVIAIVLALITKEVYSSLFVGILAGGLIYSNFNFEGTVVHVISDGFVASLADSYNVGILLFLVMLGALVAMMNKAGGSAAFGRWATKHIKSRIGAQLATIALGVLIFVDDYFNCLTVGSVMRPVTDKQNISRAKLSYLIDATAAPICIIAPISSWAAAVSGFAAGSGAKNGMALFISAIPFNFYALLTIAMMIFLAVTQTDFGPMKKHEDNAKNGDIFTVETQEAIENMEGNPKGRVWDLVVPILFLVVACIVGMIYSGGFFTADSDGYRNFITAFSNCDASVGLAYGSVIALIFAVIYFSLRRVLTFKVCMGCVPEGFKLMVPAIMILTCAWTLKAMTDSLGAKIFISQIVENSAGSFALFLPAIIFLIAVGLSFATGTSWGTFGILIPIVLSVFGAESGTITVIAISACMAGAVCGDHCSPISDTTIMASAGAQCNHIAHVSTQLPYALLVAGVSFIGYILCGFVQSAWVVLPICLVLLLGAILVIRAVQNKKAA
ncbi:MAG: Na+/H+ antiporter NhaC family protein [Clostridia bacterium]|nr:Na+/H+ antiporter NhaC family protein [Clostridia bacterium]